MTLKKRILSLNFVIAIFAVILSSVLYLNHSQKTRELKSFSKVSELLVLLIETSESFSEESAASWGASPAFADYTPEGVERYETTVKETDALFEQVHALINDMNLSEHTPRFASLVTNQLNFKERVDPIREGLRSGQVEAWPSIQLYVTQVKWLIGLIPQLSIEAHDAELVRKTNVADAIMQMRIRTARHVGMVTHNLKMGEVSEMVTTVCELYITDAEALITKILSNTTDEGVAQYQSTLQTSDWDTIIASTKVILDKGSIRQGAIPHTFDAKYAIRSEEAGAAFIDNIEGFKDFVLDDIQTHTEEQLATANWQRWQAIILGVISIGTCLASGFYLANKLTSTIRDISNSLRTKANEGLSSSNQVARTSKALADGGAQQAASIEEISSTMEEMKAISDTNSEYVTNAREIAIETDSTAKLGSEAMHEMGGAMSSIQDSSKEIANIAKEIEEIAFQTNILALNAAVEAARAGEAGAGFAIVAEEVRSLAQKCAVSASSTREKIELAISSVNEGTRISEQVHQHLDRILEQSSKFKNALDQVSQSSQQQNEGIGQVTQAISQIDKITQVNAASSEETSSAAQASRRQSESILKQIQQLEVLLRGNSNFTAPRPTQNRVTAQAANTNEVSHNRLQENILS